MAKLIASIADGRVVPWFSEEDPVPAGYVEIPLALHAKFAAGEIADGVALAKAALAGEAGVSAQAPAKPKAVKAAKAAAAEKAVEPSFPSVAAFPSEGMTRA